MAARDKAVQTGIDLAAVESEITRLSENVIRIKAELYDELQLLATMESIRQGIASASNPQE